MSRYIFRAILLSTFFFVAFTSQLYAQGNFIYVNNGGGPVHTVSGYAVAAGGALSEIPGSPFLTGAYQVSNCNGLSFGGTATARSRRGLGKRPLKG